MRKVLLFLVVVAFFVGVVVGAEEKGKTGNVDDVTGESWKAIEKVPKKWKDIRVTDKSIDMMMYSVEDVGGNIKIEKNEGMVYYPYVLTGIIRIRYGGKEKGNMLSHRLLVRGLI